MAEHLDSDRRGLLRAAAMTAVGIGGAGGFVPGLNWIGAAKAAASPRPLDILQQMPQWLNGPRPSAADLRGKVVLLNFWTYSCINSLRALPYTKAWANKYAPLGLVVVGVHTPEFNFEKSLVNVSAAVGSLGVGYPVVLDNDYRVWRAFDNDAWPGFCFIGGDGRVRRRIVGEGGYDQSERLIQRLLCEIDGIPPAGDAFVNQADGAQAPPDESELQSPETYIGYDQARQFASPGGAREDTSYSYSTPGALRRDQWGLQEAWTMGSEFATCDGEGGKLAFRFHARDLHCVLGPSARGTPIGFRVHLDGAPPRENHGFDVGPDGYGRVVEPRMYQLIRQTTPVQDRTFEITFLDAGARAYVVTFG